MKKREARTTAAKRNERSPAQQTRKSELTDEELAKVAGGGIELDSFSFGASNPA